MSIRAVLKMSWTLILKLIDQNLFYYFRLVRQYFQIKLGKFKCNLNFFEIQIVSELEYVFFYCEKLTSRDKNKTGQIFNKNFRNVQQLTERYCQVWSVQVFRSQFLWLEFYCRKLHCVKVFALHSDQKRQTILQFWVYHLHPR